MRPFALCMAILSVALLGYDSPAQGPGKRPEGQQDRARPANRDPGQARRVTRGPERDPAQLVARLMQEFDKDGDQKLDSAELTALLTSMRDRRGSGAAGRPAQPGQGRQGRPGQRRPEGDARRRPDAEKAAQPGGERPKRPDVE